MLDKVLIYESQFVGNIFIADTMAKRFLGYKFQKKPNYEAILINNCNSIDTFFMKFDIDVLFINRNMEVIKKIEVLKPGKVIMPIKDAAFVIETIGGRFRSILEGNKVKLISAFNLKTDTN